ncbi:MAG: hypothetical protein KAS32_04460, partial [Candidatus Peribacteraceae bacterium]|nr:hypothetical protein [Candidatus Peribacteraceae bacterium]
MISLSFDGHIFILGVVFGAIAHVIRDIIEIEIKENVIKMSKKDRKWWIIHHLNEGSIFHAKAELDRLIKDYGYGTNPQEY